MTESGGNDGFGGNEVSLLAEELIQLSVKSSIVEPNDKPTLICTIWTKKSYNPDSFKAKNLVIFDRLTKPMERDQIRLVSSPFWIKIGMCLPEFDKKDLLHAIGVTFGGVLRSEVNGEFCRLRIKLNVQKPLRRGIFVSIGNRNRVWIPFKYEKLPTFYFGCGRLGHGSIKKNQETYLHSEKSSDMIQGVQEDSWLTATRTGIKMQKEGEIDEKKTERSKTDEDIL
ncbi:hypothetical protein Gotur_014084, partial [Gossypium turneri]